MWKILSAAGDALSTYYPSDSSMLIIYVEPASPHLHSPPQYPLWPIGCILVRLKCNMHSHLDPHTPNQCLSHPTNYPPILIFPIPMHNCKELSSFSLCVFPLLLRHELMWDLITHVRSSVGRFSLFCGNRPVPIFSWCHENLIGSLIYKFIWAGEKRLGYQIFIFFKLTRFSDKSVLIYTTTSWLLNNSNNN
jgi:hypothetical protein